MKTFNFIFLLLFLGTITAHAQQKFTVKVTCEVNEPGKLYVSLVNKDTYEKTGGFLQQKTYVVSANQPKQKLEFQFDSVEKGIYGIRFFIDQNNNGKVDIGMFGSKEPWGMTWNDGKPKFSKPKFDQMCWNVNSGFSFPHVVVEK